MADSYVQIQHAIMGVRGAQKHFIEAVDRSEKSSDEAIAEIAAGLAELLTPMIMEMEAFSERFQRLHQKVDRIEKKLGSV